MRTLRLLGMGWLFQFKQMSRSSFDSLLAILWPLFFATVALFMFRQGDDPDALIYAGLDTVLGYQALRLMEHASRRRASIQIA